MSKILPGIHVQWPWSRLIIEGQKTIETRTYRIPSKYLDLELALIETPGRTAEARRLGIETKIIGTVIFKSCRKYLSRDEWLADISKHRVPETDLFYSYEVGKEKWAWEIRQTSTLPRPVRPPKIRGIVFAKNCRVA